MSPSSALAPKMPEPVASTSAFMDEPDMSIFENKTGLAEDMKFLASMPELCDVTFLVGETREPVCAVKVIKIHSLGGGGFFFVSAHIQQPEEDRRALERERVINRICPLPRHPHTGCLSGPVEGLSKAAVPSTVTATPKGSAAA